MVKAPAGYYLNLDDVRRIISDHLSNPGGKKEENYIEQLARAFLSARKLVQRGETTWEKLGTSEDALYRSVLLTALI
jgi:hypothetical protein